MEKYKLIRSELRDQHINNSFIGIIGSFMFLSAIALIFAGFDSENNIEINTQESSKKVRTEIIDPDIIQKAIDNLMGQTPEKSSISNKINSDYQNSKNLNSVKKLDVKTDEKDSLINKAINQVKESSLTTLTSVSSNSSLFNNGGSIDGSGIKQIGEKTYGDGMGNSNETAKFQSVEVEPNLDLQELYSVLDYPSIAKKLDVEGKVFVSVLINKEGIPIKYEIDHSDNPLLNDAATKAIMSVKYTPAIQNGKTINCWLTIPITFKLK